MNLEKETGYIAIGRFAMKEVRGKPCFDNSFLLPANIGPRQSRFGNTLAG
jgi:hypothetical protein